MSQPIVDLAAIRAAEGVLRGVVRRTPVLRADSIDHTLGAEVFLKAEQRQRSGSFKFRGAYNRLAHLTAAERRRGVIAYSSGNHAQGVGLAARELETSAVIVMPHDAPPEKRAATEALGATIVGYDRYREDREAIARELADREGRTLVPPFDDPLVIAGQGTAALELIEDVGPLDALIVCVGGGGLLAGCGTAARALLDKVAIYGAEPAAGDDHRRSLRAGERVTIPVPETIADGQQITTPGRLTWEINRNLLTGVLVATDAAITSTMAMVHRTFDEMIEPSGACALAALLHDHHELRGCRIGVTLSGGNVSATRFTSLVGRA